MPQQTILVGRNPLHKRIWSESKRIFLPDLLRFFTPNTHVSRVEAVRAVYKYIGVGVVARKTKRVAEVDKSTGERNGVMQNVSDTRE